MRGCYGEDPHCGGFQSGSPWIDAMPNPSAIAVAPTGTAVYVGSDSGVVAHFARAADGSLSFHDCIASQQEAGCSQPSSAAAALGGADALAVSSSGSDVYVGPGDNAVSHLRLDSNGNLALADCLAENVSGCGKVLGGEGVLGSPGALALTGHDLYAQGNAALTHLTTASNGALSFAACFSTLTGCAPPATQGFNQQRVTLSPDGSSLYAASAGDRFSIFARSQSTTPPAARAPSAPPPAIELRPPGAIGIRQGIVNADVNPLGQATTYHVEFGTSSSYGSRIPASDQTVGSASTLQPVSQRLPGLSPATTYHYRFVATNAAGTVATPDQTFTTAAAPPALPQDVGPIGEASAADRATTYQLNAAHNGYLSGDSLAPPLARRWSLSLGDAVSYPVIADGRVFVVTQRIGSNVGETLYALDASTGAVLWSYELDGGNYPLPGVAYDNGAVYLEGFGLRGSDRLGGLAAFDAATGAPLWSNHAFPAGCCTAPP